MIRAKFFADRCRKRVTGARRLIQGVFSSTCFSYYFNRFFHWFVFHYVYFFSSTFRFFSVTDSTFWPGGAAYEHSWIVLTFNVFSKLLLLH